MNERNEGLGLFGIIRIVMDILQTTGTLCGVQGCHVFRKKLWTGYLENFKEMGKNFFRKRLVLCKM